MKEAQRRSVELLLERTEAAIPPKEEELEIVLKEIADIKAKVDLRSAERGRLVLYF